MTFFEHLSELRKRIIYSLYAIGGGTLIGVYLSKYFVKWINKPMLKALAGPFPDVVFCPTGGITPDTAAQFLALPNVRVCGGSWLTPRDAVEARQWSRITQLARDAARLRGV